MRPNQARLLGDYGRLPLQFEENRGQTDAQVRFLSRGSGYALFLTRDEAVLQLRSADPGPAGTGLGLRNANSAIPQGEVRNPQSAIRNPKLGRPVTLRMRLVGAHPNAEARGLEELPGKVNYFIGSDPSRWRANIPTYAKVHYRNVYAGVDLVYYGNQRQLEHDFVVAPGADPKQIRLAVEGAKRVELQAQGDAVLRVGEGEVRLRAPLAYQEVAGRRRVVAASYVLHETTPHSALRTPHLDAPHSALRTPHLQELSFELGAYDPARPLVIDPVLVYSTYLGGSGNEIANGIAVDSDGNAYIVGQTLSPNFPTSPLNARLGPPNPSNTLDVFVTKLNPAGSGLVFSTYLGGSGDDVGAGIAVGPSNYVYVTGWTASTNFPTTVGAFQSARQGAEDAFVAKLNPTGSALEYSTYLGGGNLDFGRGIAVDSNGDVYVTGETNSINFPTLYASQTSNGGGWDAFVTKLSGAGSPVYSTYLGGSSHDYGAGAAVDASFNAYVTGYTQSGDFPKTPLAYQTSLGGGYDAFVTKLDATGAQAYSTYLGGEGNDYGKGIAVDSSGYAYITGFTASSYFPTLNAFQGTLGGSYTCAGNDCFDAFATKLDTAGSTLIYSTYLGGAAYDAGNSIAVDSNGNAYIAGSTASTDFPTALAYQSANSGMQDAFVLKLGASGTTMLFSTYLGGAGIDSGNAIAVDSAGDVYVAGETQSVNFPTAGSPPLQGALAAGGDAFVAKLTPPGPPAGGPTISSLNPPNAKAGDPAFTLTINGSGFGPSSVVYWDAGVRTTTWVSNAQLTANIDAGDIAAPKTVQVNVFDPSAGAGGAWSNIVPFLVYSVSGGAPTIVSLSPSKAVAGGPAFALTINGSGFGQNSSTVYWSDLPVPTTYVDSTKLTAEISKDYVAAPATAQVKVFDSTGGWSNSAPFLVYLVGAQPGCTPPPSGLVLWWPAQGDTTELVSGTLSGYYPYYSPGKVGLAFDFSSNSYFDVSSVPSMTSLTIDAWIKPTASNGRIVDKFDGSSSGYALGVTADGYLSLTIGSTSLLSTTPLTTDGSKWTHVAAVFDSTQTPPNQMKLYIDGVLDPNTTVTAASLLNNGLPLRIGADQSYGSNFYGLIDELEIFDRALAVSGSVTTNATDVAWVSGSPFDLTWTGTITINNIPYTIATVNSNTSITLTASAGTQEGVPYSIGPEILAIVNAGSVGKCWADVMAAAAVQVDLMLSKNAPYSAPLSQGESINLFTYTLTVINTSPDPAYGVVVTDTLPPGMTLDYPSSSQGTCFNNGSTVTCYLGTLSGLYYAAVELSVYTFQPGLVTNTASVSSINPDPEMSNNVASVDVTVAVPAPVISYTVPDSAVVGQYPSGLTLLVYGSYFGPNSEVRWNGAPRFTDTTNYLTGELSAQIDFASGTVNTNGTDVTWVSGSPFDLTWTGAITINSVAYTIATVNSGISITLTGPAGTQTGVAYSKVVENGDLAKPGVAQITVYDPATGESAPQAFMIYPSSPAGCVPPPSGLVSWWPGERNGNDVMGRNSGTLKGSVAFAPGMVNEAFSLDGSSYIEVPDSPSLAITDAMTIDAWIKRTADKPGCARIVDKITPGGSDGFLLDVCGGYLHMKVGPWELTGTTLLPLNEFVHVAGVFSGYELHLYVNGVQDGYLYLGGWDEISAQGRRQALSVRGTPKDYLYGYPPIPTNHLNLLIGANQEGGGKFVGLIDEVEIYNTALYSEISAIYSAGPAGKCNPFACAPPPPDLVSWWPGESDGRDLAGANPATPQGNVTLVPAMVGQGFHFDGTNSYLQVADSATLKPPTAFTIDAWVKFDPLGAFPQVLLSKYDPQYHTGYMLVATPGEVEPVFELWLGNGQVEGGLSVYSYATITPGVFYHVAATWDGTTHTASLYVNGVLEPPLTQSDIVVNNGHPLLMGTSGDSEWFAGTLDEVEFYGRALSSEEIASIYMAGGAGKCTAPYSPDLVLTKEATLNSNLTYTLTVTNSSEQSATGVIVTDPLPEGVSFVSASASPSGTCTETTGTVTCILGTLIGGAAPTTITLVTQPTVSGEVTNTATVTLNEPDPDTSNNTATVKTTINPVPAAIAAVSGSPQTGTVGAALSQPLVVKVTDQFSNPVSGVTVTFAVSPTGGATLSTPAATDSNGQTQVTATLGNTPGTITVTASVTGVSTPASFSLTAAASAPTLASILPTTAPAGTGGLTLTVNGSNFVPGSVVRWNGQDRTTTPVDNTHLSAAITTADLAVAGTALVTVFNPAPGGGTTSPAPFTIGFLIACTPPPSGLVGWWPGDGNTWDLAVGNNGTPFNDAGFGAGVVGQGFSLSGVSRYLDVGNPAALRVSAGDFTVDTWVKFNSLTHPPGTVTGPAGDMSIVDKMSAAGTNQDGWLLSKQANNRFWFCLGGGGANGCEIGASTLVQSATVATTGVWYHVTAVKTSSTISIYVNGVKETTTSLGSFTDTHAASLKIGASAGEGAYLNGLVDEVEVFNRALSDAEIATIYNASALGKCRAPMPAITSLSPPSQAAGGAAFPLVVSGSNFQSNSVVRWNLSDRARTYGSATQLTATMPATDLALVGTAQVSVFTPLGGESAPATFTITGLIACAAPPSGLVSWWTGESGAQDITDGNSGTLVNGATMAPGKVGQALSFDGIDDRVLVPSNANLSATGPFAVALWFKADPSQLSPDGYFELVDTSHGFVDGTGWALQGTVPSRGPGSVAGAMNFEFGLGGSDAGNFLLVSTGVSVLDNAWHHVVGMFTGSEVQIYLDGILKQSQPQTSPVASNSRGLYIGAAWGGGTPTRHFHGLIDEAQYYTRALSLAEIRSLYNAGGYGLCHQADLALTMTAPSSSTLGVNVNYTLTVTNNGPVAASGVVGSLPLPAGASLVSSGASQGSCASSAVVTCALGNIASGAAVTVNLLLHPTQSGTLSATASVSGNEADPNSGNNTAGASTSLSGWVYVVGDSAPSTSDAVGAFGDGVLDNLDLIGTLRAITWVPGFRPPDGSDRFDAIDAYPTDTEVQRGGDGALDNLDLLASLRRVTNADPSRPTRTSVSLPTRAPGMVAMGRPSLGQAGNLRLEFGEARADAGRGVVPIYLVGAARLELMGLSLALGLPGGGGAPLAWLAGDAGAPTLTDHGLPGTLALSWLGGLRLQAGQRVLLGYAEITGAPTDAARLLRFFGAIANSADGRPLAVGLPSLAVEQR